MDRNAIAAALVEFGELIELSGENPFRARAYLSAARALTEYSGPLATSGDAAALAGLPGIGSSMVKKIAALLETGTVTELETLRAKVPAGLRELLRVPGLGTKKILQIHAALGVKDVAGLEEAIGEHRLVQIPGFGPKTQENIAESLGRMRRFEGQWLLPEARVIGDAFRRAVQEIPGVTRASLAGEVRRGREIVGAIDLVAVAAEPEDFLADLTSRAGIAAVLAREPGAATFRLSSGLTANVRAVNAASFATALCFATGSEAHCLALQHRAAARAWRLDATGLFRGERGVGSLAMDEERDLYRTLGLPWIPPECREGTDEIERAERGELERLIVPSDLRLLLHCHSTWSDGRASIAQMACAAAARGYAAIGISDHSRSAGYAGGLDLDRVLAQRAEIDRLNQGGAPIPILAGIESDILADGTLDYPDEILAGFDFVIASVHSRFRMERDEMTARVLRAVASPWVNILAHPTGRLLLRRDPYDIDLGAVIAACAREGVAMEINATPDRLDLDWREIPRAREAGALFAINPDAHAPEQMEYVTWGIIMARKAGLTAGEVLNTWDLARARSWFRRRRPPAGDPG